MISFKRTRPTVVSMTAPFQRTLNARLKVDVLVVIRDPHFLGVGEEGPSPRTDVRAR